jgi:hypothetical protein
MTKKTYFISQLLILSVIIIGCQPSGNIGKDLSTGEHQQSTPTVMPNQQSTPTVVPNQQSTPTVVPNLLANSVFGKFIRLAWFYKPPNVGQLDLLRQYFDFFILTHKDEVARDWLKDNGVTAPILQYILLTEIIDPGDCVTDPYGNQVAYKAGDFCQISKQHPDWFLLDQKGDRIQSASGNNYMDPGNPGYREFWLERAREMHDKFGWNGVFMDNLEASRKKFTDQGIIPANYPNDASYQIAVEGFLAFLRNNYFQPSGHPMSGNIVSVDDNNVWLNYLQYLDAVMIESFATSWSDGYQFPIEWERQMSIIEAALEKGKTLILVAQGDQADTDLQRFAYASYLLIANGNAIFRYSNSDFYREVWIYDDYTLDLGTPLGQRKHQGLSWRRDFTHGYVSVNPWTHSAQISVKP